MSRLMPLALFTAVLTATNDVWQSDLGQSVYVTAWQLLNAAGIVD